MKTIQASTTNLICYTHMNKNILNDLLTEILPPVEKANENIVEQLDYETVMEYELLQRCFYEVLRIEPPVPNSFASYMTE